MIPIKDKPNLYAIKQRNQTKLKFWWNPGPLVTICGMFVSENLLDWNCQTNIPQNWQNI